MRDFAAGKHRLRITLAACITAVTAATLAAQTAVSPAAAGAVAVSPATAGPAAPAQGTSAAPVTVHPDAIRLPGAATPGPATTTDCEQAEGIACFSPDQLRAAYELSPLYAQGITGKGATIMIVDSFGSPTIKIGRAHV